MQKSLNSSCGMIVRYAICIKVFLIREQKKRENLGHDFEFKERRNEDDSCRELDEDV